MKIYVCIFLLQHLQMHMHSWPYHTYTFVNIHTHMIYWYLYIYIWITVCCIYNGWAHDFGITQLEKQRFYQLMIENAVKRKGKQAIWTKEKSSEWVDLHSQSGVQLAPKEHGFGRFIPPCSFHGFKFQLLNFRIVPRNAAPLIHEPFKFWESYLKRWTKRANCSGETAFFLLPHLVICGAARPSTIFAPKAWTSWAMIRPSRKVPCQGQQVSQASKRKSKREHSK